MKGTVAPPSSKATALSTCAGRTRISSAICVMIFCAVLFGISQSGLPCGPHISDKARECAIALVVGELRDLNLSRSAAADSAPGRRYMLRAAIELEHAD